MSTFVFNIHLFSFSLLKWSQPFIILWNDVKAIMAGMFLVWFCRKFMWNPRWPKMFKKVLLRKVQTCLNTNFTLMIITWSFTLFYFWYASEMADDIYQNQEVLLLNILYIQHRSCIFLKSCQVFFLSRYLLLAWVPESKMETKF